MKAGSLRHYVTIRRPSAEYGSRGQVQAGQDESLLSDVPCEIEQLSGRQLEFARQQFATATHRVRMYRDPANPLSAKDYLVLADGRRLHIGAVDDVNLTGLEYVLLCGESRP